jgi:hypothetical protein
MYEMSDGRKLVLPLLKRSVAGVSLFEGSNPIHCGVGGVLASQGPRSIEVAAVLQMWWRAERSCGHSGRILHWPRSGQALCRRGVK